LEKNDFIALTVVGIKDTVFPRKKKDLDSRDNQFLTMHIAKQLPTDGETGLHTMHGSERPLDIRLRHRHWKYWISKIGWIL